MPNHYNVFVTVTVFFSLIRNSSFSYVTIFLNQVKTAKIVLN